MKNILLPLFIILSAIVNIQAQFISKANYALAEKFRNIGLGSLFAQNSMTIYPRFINGTDKFWFDFRSSQGTSHYFVDPEGAVQKVNCTPKVRHKTFGVQFAYEKNIRRKV